MSFVVDTRTRNIATVVIVFVVVFLAYSQTITFDWVHYDDDTYVLMNPLIGLAPFKALGRVFSEGYYRSYTPMALASHALDLRAWGPEPAGHHLTNVFLHSLNAVWVMLLSVLFIQRVGRAADADPALLDAAPEEMWTGFSAALLFAFHPLRAESVAWIADRKDLLAAAFALPAAILYVRGRFSKRSRITPATLISIVILFALGSLSKTSSIALAGVLLLVDATVVEKGRGWKEMLYGARFVFPLIVVGTLVGILAVRAAPPLSLTHGADILTPAALALLPAYTIMFYVWKTLFPLPLVPIYVPPGTLAVIVAAAALAALIGVAVMLFFRGFRPALIALGAYILLILPTIAGFSAGIEAWADRYSYLPSVPFFLLAAWGLSTWARKPTAGGFPSRRALATVFGTFIVAAELALMIVQTRIWRDEFSLWSHQLSHGNRHSIALNAMGVAYLKRGEPRQAETMFTEALRVDARYVEPLLNLRFTLVSRPDTLRLFGVYQEMVSGTTNDPRIHTALGELYRGLGMDTNAIVEFRIAQSMNSDLADTYHDIGYWHLQHGRIDSATANFRAAIEKAPGYSPPYYVLGMMALARKDTAEGVRALTISARLGNSSAKRALQGLGLGW